MSIIGKYVKDKKGDTLLVIDKFMDSFEQRPPVDKYLCAYESGGVTILFPSSIVSIELENPKAKVTSKG